MKITQKQFENLDLIHEELKKKYPQFGGFGGSADNMKVAGLDEDTVIAEMNKMDLDTLRAAKDTVIDLTERARLLKVLGLTQKDIDSIKEISVKP